MTIVAPWRHRNLFYIHYAIYIYTIVCKNKLKQLRASKKQTTDLSMTS